MSVSETFDQYALKYDRWYEKNQSVYLSELKALKYFLSLKSKSLEIGIGTGRFASGLNIDIGIDISFEMLKIAHNRNLNVFKADGKMLPFKNNIFDAVLINTTLSFVANPLKVLLETKRVLKKTGIVVLGIIDKNSTLGKKYQKRRSGFYKYADFFSPDEVINLLRKCGFVNFFIRQTLFNYSGQLNECDVSKPGYGKGSFVVIKSECSQ